MSFVSCYFSTTELRTPFAFSGGFKMASPTKISERRRELRKINMGAKRKRKLRVEGSTMPTLLLNMPNANEKAQAARKKS
jgi:hypothetical protein